MHNMKKETFLERARRDLCEINKIINKGLLYKTLTTDSGKKDREKLSANIQTAIRHASTYGDGPLLDIYRTATGKTKKAISYVPFVVDAAETAYECVTGNQLTIGDILENTLKDYDNGLLSFKASEEKIDEKSKENAFQHEIITKQKDAIAILLDRLREVDVAYEEFIKGKDIKNLLTEIDSSLKKGKTRYIEANTIVAILKELKNDISSVLQKIKNDENPSESLYVKAKNVFNKFNEISKILLDLPLKTAGMGFLFNQISAMGGVGVYMGVFLATQHFQGKKNENAIKEIGIATECLKNNILLIDKAIEKINGEKSIGWNARFENDKETNCCSYANFFSKRTAIITAVGVAIYNNEYIIDVIYPSAVRTVMDLGLKIMELGLSVSTLSYVVEAISLSTTNLSIYETPAHNP